MMCDLGFDVMIGATATEHMVHRQGIGCMPHIDFAHLWSQYGVGSNRVVVRCVSGEQIVAVTDKKENHELNSRAVGRSAHEEAARQSLPCTRA